MQSTPHSSKYPDCKLIVFGYLHDLKIKINVASFRIPQDVKEMILSFYPKKFKFHSFDNRYIVSKNGQTVTSCETLNTTENHVTLFGEYLTHKNGDKFSCKFWIEDGGWSAVGFGFITPEFTSWISYEHEENEDIETEEDENDGEDETNEECVSSDEYDESHSCWQWANNWFTNSREFPRYDDQLTDYFADSDDDLTIEIDMEKQIGKIQGCVVGLPDVVHIAFSSGNVHTVTAYDQKYGDITWS
eukprot:79093_1